MVYCTGLRSSKIFGYSEIIYIFAKELHLSLINRQLINNATVSLCFKQSHPMHDIVV